MTAPHPIIEASDISFSYGAEAVLRGVSLEVAAGEYLGVIGPNGAGKTTLLKIFLGLLKPAGGSVKLFGADVAKFADWYRIGYLPQKAVHLEADFPATVEEVVLMGRIGLRGLARRLTPEDLKEARNVLVEAGMWDLRKRRIGDLSGGQQQRVFIARALVSRPEIIFLDEPAFGVDMKGQEEFYSLLRALNREKGLTLVLISHDIEMVTREASRIACIDRTLVCNMPPKDFLAESVSADLFGHDVKVITHRHQR